MRQVPSVWLVTLALLLHAVTPLGVQATVATMSRHTSVPTNFPTLHAAQSSNGGGSDDAVAAKLNTTGSALVYWEGAAPTGAWR